MRTNLQNLEVMCILIKFVYKYCCVHMVEQRVRVFSGKDTARVWSGSEGLTAPFGPFCILSYTSVRLNPCTCWSFWRLSSKPVLVFPGLNRCADVVWHPWEVYRCARFVNISAGSVLLGIDLMLCLHLKSILWIRQLLSLNVHLWHLFEVICGLRLLRRHRRFRFNHSVYFHGFKQTTMEYYLS